MDVIVELPYEYIPGSVRGFPTYRPLGQEYSESISKIFDAIDWLDENDIRHVVCYDINKVGFILKSEEDAVAFKLRWV